MMVPRAWVPGYQPLSNYRLAEPIGKGAFGEVWRAIGPGGMPVALKRIELSGDARVEAGELSALELFKQVRHPHLLSIHGAWHCDGLLIIGCELADESLADALKKLFATTRAGMPSESALKFMIDAAEALDYLGRPIHPCDGRPVRIQHCDVKPANLLKQGGAVKVADFGLAKALERVLVERSASGTTAYAAPEFFQGMVAASSDQYSLAVTYYQLRTGRLPFQGSPSEVIDGHLNRPPDLRGLNDQEQAIVLRALSKNPKLRWDNCTKFIGELARANAPARIDLDGAILSTVDLQLETPLDGPTVEFRGRPITSGRLLIGQSLIEVPLRHTQIQVSILGPACDVCITQHFVNTSTQTIEATYAFPLPENAAIHRMRMIIGERRIESQVQAKQPASSTYQSAKRAGDGAALVEQENANVFTTSVANILPGQEVRIAISYLQTLAFDGGHYRLHVPLIVSLPQVPGTVDLTQPVAGDPSDSHTAACIPPDMVRGDTLGIEVQLDAGVPLCGFDSPSHDVETILEEGSTRVELRLRPNHEIPNRDFVLNYRVRSQRIEHSILYQCADDGNSGHFLLITTPPLTVASRYHPKAIVLVIDCSASMHGSPLDQAQQAALCLLESLNPEDHFNLLAFNDQTTMFAEAPVPASEQNKAQARAFIVALEGSGGTEMLMPLRAAFRMLHQPQIKPRRWFARLLGASAARRNVRGEVMPTKVVVWITNGHASKEHELLRELRPEVGDTRVVAFGIGQAIHRKMPSRLAAMSGGFAEYLHPNEQLSVAISRTLQRLGRPILTDIQIDADPTIVHDLLPAEPADIYSERPLIVYGCFKGKRPPRLRLLGRLGGQAYAQEIIPDQVNLKAAGGSLSALWAAQMIQTLSDRSWQEPHNAPLYRQQIIDLAIKHGLATDYTSFVAVDRRTLAERAQATEPLTVHVPQLMPESSPLNLAATALSPDSSPQSAATWRASRSSAQSTPTRKASGISVHSKLNRVRKPRCHITCDVASGGATAKQTLPFTIGVVGDFHAHGIQAPLTDRQFSVIDRDNFDDVMRQLNVELKLSVKNVLEPASGALPVHLQFSSIADFRPESIVQQIGSLRQLFEECRSAEGSGDDGCSLDTRPLESLLQQQLRLIMTSPDFRSLEGSWRGLKFLVANTETGAALRICVLSCTKFEMSEDVRFNGFAHLDTKLRQMMDSGWPIGLLIGDYNIDTTQDDCAFLQRFGALASKWNCLFVSQANLDAIKQQESDVISPLELRAELLSSFTSAAWRDLRNCEESRFVGLVWPPLAARYAYGRDKRTDNDWGFEELPSPAAEQPNTHTPQISTWMNAAYGLGQVIADSYARTGHFTDVLGATIAGAVSSAESDGNVQVKLGSVGLPRLLIACRFAQAIQCLARDLAHDSQSQLERKLRDFLAQYVSGDADASESDKLQLPLRLASVTLRDFSNVAPHRATWEALLDIQPWLSDDSTHPPIRLSVSITRLS